MSHDPRPPSVRSPDRSRRERGRPRRRSALATSLLFLTLPAACETPEDSAESPAPPAVDAWETLRSSAFRIRADPSAPLNAEHGWALRLRALADDGTPGAARLVDSGTGAREADSGAVLPLVALPERAEVVVLYRRSDGGLWERRSREGGALTEPVRVTDHRVVQNAVDSDQAGADAVGYEGSVHVLFIDDGTGDLLHSWRPPTGAWEPARTVVEGIRAQWVRGAVVTDAAEGSPVYGFVYDAGSDRGSGMNRYGEVPLGAPPSSR